MNKSSREDLLEAGRLTKAGRLTEATALLQRVLTRKVTTRPQTAGIAPHAPASPSSPRVAPKPVAMTPVAATPVGPTAPVGRQTLAAAPLPLPNVERPVRPGSGRFLTASYRNAAGARTYKLYVPSGYHERPVPLIVMLHGCSQSPDDFAAGTRMNVLAEEFTCLVAYPAQPASANAGKCWNWFKPGDQRRGSGEPSLIAGITRAIGSEYAVDASRVYIAGLSAGGGAAAVAAAAYPDVYAALGVHSGVPCAVARDVSSAFSLMQRGGTAGDYRSAGDPSQTVARTVPTIVFHGDRDSTVHPSNADLIVAQSAHAHLRTTVSAGGESEGHAYTRTLYRDPAGRTLLENWVVHGAGHAWLGGSSTGSYTDVRGPNASREMMRFFLEHRAQEPDRKMLRE